MFDHPHWNSFSDLRMTREKEKLSVDQVDWALLKDTKPRPARRLSISTEEPEVAPSQTPRGAQTARGASTARNGYQTIDEHRPMKFNVLQSMDAYPGDRRRSSGELGLPPIAPRARPSSSHSRPSSHGSLAKQHEKPGLISVDTAVEGTQRRNHISPTSTASNQTGSGSNKDTSGSFLKHRTRSWCATEQNAGVSPRLETLAERNRVNIHAINDVTRQRYTSETEMKGVTRSNTNHLLPRTRRLSSNSSNPNSLSKTKRAKSYGNLTKLSDSSSRNYTTINSTQRMSQSNRFGSEQNLSRKDSLVAPAPCSQGGPSRLTMGPRSRTMVTDQSTRQGLRHSHSQPVIKSQGATTPADHGRYSVDQTESDDSDEKHNRILEWLIGVETSAEPPEEPAIEENPPAQTDTAIHIVYKGDS